MKRLVGVLMALSLAAAAAPALAGSEGVVPDISYETFVLPNGLTVILHEDHKAPIVAVNVWYHVGSKNEKPGKTGFAHLFEHLMFNGSEHFNDDYFKAMDRVGATDLNGTTNIDRTNYFQNVPTSALDTALFMESDRMGHLLGAIDQARLDEQRGVVQNEKRQGENQPYGVTRTLLSENTYPVGHPYHWTTIGSMEDLDAASLDDVKEWFKTYYGPNNAVLAIAGDIDPATVKTKVEEYFGDIPPGPPIAKQTRWIAKMTGEHRSVVQDRVPQARLYKVWNVPEWGSTAAIRLNLVTDVLASGKSSRLYKRLVYDDQVATDVSAFIWEKELGSQVYIVATAAPGKDLQKVEEAVDEELAKLLADGPTSEELARAKAEERAGFIRGAERIGGFGGTSDILASNMVYAGDPSYYKTRMTVMLGSTPSDVRDVARTWLSDGVYVLEVHPFPQLAAETQGIDRSALPAVAQPPEPAFPAFTSVRLHNGLRVIAARRDAVPTVEMRLLVDAGWAADGKAPGTANLTMEMLDEGTASRSALQISDGLASIGARLRTSSSLDTCTVSLSALSDSLPEALDIFTDVVEHPSFPTAELERLRAQQLAAIRSEKVNPRAMGLRVAPLLLYPAGHAYAVPGTGSGSEATVAALTADELAAFHRSWFRPNNATLVVVGAVSMDDLVPRLEKAFADWQAGDVPSKNVAPVSPAGASRVYLIDRPGSQQSMVLAAEVAPPAGGADEVAIEAMNQVLGGTFTARINMNLREDKHWTYGARTAFIDARGPRPYLAYAPVQADKTADTMREIHDELAGIVGSAPPTRDELDRVQASLTLTLPGRWETNRAVARSLSEMVELGYPEDYFNTYADKIRSLTLSDVADAAAEVVHPAGIVWVVIGDRAHIEAPMRELGYGDVVVVDADGNPVEG